MKRVRGYHILFGVALVVLIALAAWWTVFFLRSVELEREAGLGKAVHVAVVTALILGQREKVPPPGTTLEGNVPVEVIRLADRRPNDGTSPMIPRHPDLGVRPASDLLARIEREHRRRRVMVMGEGSLLFLLLGVCTFMLFQLVRAERRHMKNMESFVSTVTHEMKTPLAGLKSMLQTFAAGNVPEDRKQALYAMGLKEAERLEHMVENVLLSGRLRTQRLEVNREPVALRPLVDRFVEHRRRYMVGRPETIELQWDGGGDGVRVLADPNALHVVLENLTDNALKYGGDRPRVTLRVRRESGRVALSVEDRGIGFDPAEADRLFAPFHRSRDLAGPVQHGTGLGLTIARVLVEHMGGTLAAFSEGPGKGARFTVTLREV